MRLSLLELPTLVSRAVMVAGLPRGAAGAAARLVGWLELEWGNGLAFLEDELPALAGGEPGRVVVKKTAGSGVQIDAGGGHALLLAPGSLDLACARARAEGRASVVVRNCRGILAAAPLADQAAARGLVGLAVSDQGAIAAIPTEAGPWRYDIAAADRAQAIAAASHAAGYVMGNIEGAERLAAEIAGAATTSALRRTRNYLVLCADSAGLGGGEALRRQLEDLLGVFELRWRAQPPDEIAARRRRAETEGLEVDAGLWARLRAYGDRVLVPNSERSRRGTGE